MTKTSKTIVFFGNEKLATGIPLPQPVILQAVQTAGFTVEKVITGSLSTLGSHQAQVAVLAAYGRIIPQSVLDEFPLGIINIHPSLLPLYRGPTPIEQAILDGASKTGVSIMRLSAGMDEGPIYKQRALSLRGDETKIELTKHLQQLGAELLIEILPRIANKELNPRTQPHPDRASYSHKLTKNDGVIDWTKPANQIEREIRAFAGWPNSRTILFDKELIITTSRVLDVSGAPGALEIIDKQLVVYCGQQALIIDRLKPAGKQEMTGQAFLAGYHR